MRRAICYFFFFCCFNYSKSYGVNANFLKFGGLMALDRTKVGPLPIFLFSWFIWGFNLQIICGVDSNLNVTNPFTFLENLDPSWKKILSPYSSSQYLVDNLTVDLESLWIIDGEISVNNYTVVWNSIVIIKIKPSNK